MVLEPLANRVAGTCSGKSLGEAKDCLRAPKVGT